MAVPIVILILLPLVYFVLSPVDGFGIRARIHYIPILRSRKCSEGEREHGVFKSSLCYTCFLLFNQICCCLIKFVQESATIDIILASFVVQPVVFPEPVRKFLKKNDITPEGLLRTS